jgi:hypothetical protein
LMILGITFSISIKVGTSTSFYTFFSTSYMRGIVVER